MSDTPDYLIPPGPGHIDRANAPYGVHAFVALTLEYNNMAPSDTRAVLHLKASEADEGIADIDIGIELTAADLKELAGAANAIRAAALEDDQ